MIGHKKIKTMHLMGENESNEYTVMYWRVKFKELRPKLDREWMKQVGAFEAHFSTADGLNMLLQVQKGRACLANTQRVVQTVERLLDKKESKGKRRRSLAKRQKLATA
ncbi:hypothetical protein [Fibrella aquatilis]|uniref:Uncharacterized protein n=1 Tax=Fibrella aquatilis TaxID=2817059 RepID=A0A939G7Z9_9BACT|nr:hypothetical protein [Fibrella aquatilis]MBO0933889.1 hypothetical protein [Fibrella aquatilis]